MIVAEQKPIAELKKMIGDCRRVLVAGCETCVAECAAGGEREVEILASALRMALRLEGREVDILEATAERQCEWEFIEELANQVEAVDLVLSTACGIGAQVMAERFADKRITPALNTTFLGFRDQEGVWVERCAACGECILDKTGGICPIARCSKSLLNGPCGGSHQGKCEINPELDCAWQLIVDRLEARGELEKLLEVQPPKDWSTARDGGPRKIVREDLRP
jgi:ferredoxin